MKNRQVLLTDGFYTVHAQYRRDGAFVGQALAVPASRVSAVKRALRKSAVSGCRLTFAVSPSEVIRDEGVTGDPWFVCKCKNCPEHDGYFACDAKGQLQSTLCGSPLSEWSGEHLICATCGRYFAINNLVVLGRNTLEIAAIGLGITLTDIAYWSVQIGHDERCSLTAFLCNNESEPGLLSKLRASLDSKPFSLGAGEVKLVAPTHR